jgi:ornithine carbamoyltransferase
MSPNLKNRTLLSIDELSAPEVAYLIDLAQELKREQQAGSERARLRGKHIALLLDPSAPRAPGAFEAAASAQGANLSLIGPGDWPLAALHDLQGTARVLGRLYDAVECRGFAPALVRELAQHAGVPVYDGLTRPFHPTQVLADCLTMQHHCPGRPLAQMRLAYLGDARYRIGATLLQGAALMGLDFRIGAPRAFWPPQSLIDAALAKARHSGAQLRLTESAAEAVQAADYLYTDAWLAPAEPAALWAERVEQLRPYQVNAGLMQASGNPAAKLLHGQAEAQGPEVSAEVFAANAAVLQGQAENRLHSIKALLVATVA